MELDGNRSVASGSPEALQSAVRNGADLRIYTEFRHNEHVEPGSDNHEIVREVSDFRVTYLVENRWVAGIMNLRMPITPPDGFGSRPSMSLFMYNQDGRQAVARPYLDGAPVHAAPGPSSLDDNNRMPRYHQIDAWDSGTNAPSSNFIYDFGVYRYFVRDDWREVFAHEDDGTAMTGSPEALFEAFSLGAETKVAIRGLCRDLDSGMDHEVFVQTGPGYYSTERKIFCAGTQPVIRVAPAIPMRYKSRGWDFGWLLARSDGTVFSWLCDPYSLKFNKSSERFAVRWFVR